MTDSRKIAFLASRTISPESVLKCYDWATDMCKAENCVISGFHSKLEKDVLHFLLKGRQPIIVVLGRAPYKRMPAQFIGPVKEKRLTIISTANTSRHTRETAMERNKKIVDMADEIVFASLTPDSSLYALYENAIKDGKKVSVL